MNKKEILSLTIIILLLFLTIFFGPIIINYDKTGNNTSLLGKDYSHLSRQEILSKIDQDFTLPDNITLVLPDQKEINFQLATISAQINKEDIASNMLSRGLSQGFISYIKYFFKPKSFNLKITIDNSKLTQQINFLASLIDKPFVPTKIIYKNNLISVNVGSTGTQFDQESFVDNLNNSLISGDFNQKIKLEAKSIGSIPTQDQVNQAKTNAQKIIKKTLILTQDNQTFTIDSATLISWLGFNSDYQTDLIQEYIQTINPNFKKEATDAVLEIDDNKRVTKFIPAKDGMEIKSDELISLTTDSLSKLITSDSLSLGITIPITTTSPKIKNEDTNNLGIKELIGRGTSTFKHSSSNRNLNVQRGSSIVNNILVAPKETFSFLKNLGEVSLENGFKKEYVIREGKTVLDVGGGICQVSTTFFRAILDAGLNIIERQAHAYRVSYYEEDSKPGFDATVFIPSPDLKFINDTEHYVLIRSIYDGVNKRLTYEIYGTNDGRKVEISNYKQWGYQAAPADIYNDDPTLPVGTVVQDEHRVPGLKTSFDWKVTTTDGTVLRQKTFTSNYVPWAAVYRRGTKVN